LERLHPGGPITEEANEWRCNGIRLGDNPAGATQRRRKRLGKSQPERHGADPSEAAGAEDSACRLLRVLSQQLPYLNLVGFEGGWLRGTGDRNRGNVAPYLFRSTAATHIYIGGRVDALRFLEC
jgi:hypothetical protein